MPARCRRLLHRRAGLALGGAEGGGNALLGGVGLPVDAVGVDLEQDGDTVPGAAGDLGSGHPGVEPQRDFVPYRLMWARSSRTSSGGIGIVLVSLSARCFRTRSCRAVSSSVQAVAARAAEAART